MTELTTRSVLNKMRGYRVTQGYGAGSNLRVLPWERDLVRGDSLGAAFGPVGCEGRG